MKKQLSKILIILVFFVGLSVLLYPTVSNAWNLRVQTRAITDYKAISSKLSDNANADELLKAEEYNENLSKLTSPLTNHKEISGYETTLDISGTGIMGYITIAKLGVELPIYHGTGDAVLNVAVGHLQGSSLPIGGAGTHSVLSAHRGLPSAKLFSDLDKMENGDIFTITVLDKKLSYQVDQILVVKPWQVDSLYTIGNGDYCTLMTCTPYGINSHRLLVRGKRIENIKPLPHSISSNAKTLDPRCTAPFFAAPLLAIMTIMMLIKSRKKFSHKGERKYAKT